MTHLHRLALASLGAQAADQLALAALPLVATLSLGAGPGLTGLLVAAQSAAWLLVSLPAGALVDAAEKRRLMLASQALAASLLPAAAVLALAGWQAPLALVAMLGSAGTVAFALAAFAAVPALTPDFALANARLELARAAATLAAPALAGLLASKAGLPEAGLLLAAASALGALLAVRGLPLLPPAATKRPPLLPAIREGAGFVARHPLLRAIAITAIAWNTGFMALMAVFIPFALQRLGMDAAAAGLALSAYGAGLVAGALAAPGLMRRCAPGSMMLSGPLLSAVAAALMLAAPQAPGILLPALAWFLIGFGPMLWQVAQTSLRQAVAPPALLGRVGATLQTAVWGVRPLGALAGGLMAGAYGLDAAVALAAAGFGLSLLAVCATPLATLRGIESGRFTPSA